MWPSDEELSKLSDEHKAMLAQKCVNLLMKKSVVEEAVVADQVCVCVCVCSCVIILPLSLHVLHI